MLQVPDPTLAIIARGTIEISAIINKGRLIDHNAHNTNLQATIPSEEFLFWSDGPKN